MKKVICIVVGILLASVAFGQKKRVLIETSVGNVDPNLKDMFMSLVEASLNNSGEFTVLPNRDEYKKKILGELEAQEGGLIRDDEWFSLGKARGADMVIYTKLNCFDEQYSITVNMFDIESGEAHKTINPLFYPRSEIVSKGGPALVELITQGGISSKEKNVNAVKCSAVPGLKISGATQKCLNWMEATDNCEKLGYGWRLPTKSELEAIIRGAYKNPSAYGIKWNSTTYWTSDERNSSSAYSVEFPSGYSTYESKYSDCAFRCVNSE